MKNIDFFRKQASLTYGTTKLDVKLSESSGSYYMRLTGTGNKVCDLQLTN